MSVFGVQRTSGKYDIVFVEQLWGSHSERGFGGTLSPSLSNFIASDPLTFSFQSLLNGTGRSQSCQWDSGVERRTRRTRMARAQGFVTAFGLLVMDEAWKIPRNAMYLMLPRPGKRSNGSPLIAIAWSCRRCPRRFRTVSWLTGEVQPIST